MGQFTQNGVIYEEMPGGKAKVVGYAPAATPAAPGSLAGKGTFIPAPPKPTLPYEGPQAAANLQRTQQEIVAANATAASTAAKTKDEAAKTHLDLITAQEAYAAGHPKGTGATVIGPDSIKSLSVPDQELVKALADGRLAFPGGFALKAPWWQQKLEQVAQYDPSFDATNFNNRAKARATLLNGKVGASANALNTAIGHLDLLHNQIGGTASHSFTPANTVINAFEQMTGDPGITNFKDTAGKLASELTSVYRNGGGAEADVVRQLQSLNASASQSQKENIVRNALELLASKQAANLYQYNIGSGGKPEVNLLDPAARAVLDKYPDIRDKYFAQPPPPLSKEASALIVAHGGTPPPPSGPVAPPSSDLPPPVGPSGHDYSGMTGAPSAGVAVANQKSMAGALAPTWRTVYDPVGAAALSTFIKKGAPYETAAAYAQSHGFNPPDPKDYAAAVTFAAAHGGATNVEADRSVPTTLGERLASSPLAAGVAAGTSAGTAGFADTLGRALAGPGWDANRAALAATNPTADLAGNVAGGVGAALVAPELAGRFLPGNLAGRAASLAESNPLAARLISNGGYGGAYGANENPDNPVKGGLLGAITGAAAGEVGQKATGGLANIIAPPEGAFGPAYAQGVFPTVGQRFGQSGVVGRALNTAEQAMQSFPGLGAMVARARDIPRDAAQIGAFNDALGDLKPFAAAGHDVPNALPPGTQPGTAPHAFTADAFNKAYPIARSGMQMVPGPEYDQATQAFANKWFPLLNDQQKSQLSNLIQGSSTSRIKAGGGLMNGEAYQQAASDIGDAAKAWSGSEPLLSQAASEYGGILDNAARASSDPQSVALLDAADRGYAKYAGVIRPASARVGGDPGEFTMKAFDRSVQNNAAGPNGSQYLRGTALMQPYAEAIRPLGDVLANSGAGERLMTNRLFMGEQGAAGVGGATALALGAHIAPGALAPFLPYAPGANAIFTRAIAPRQYTLPPAFADALNLTGAKVNELAPLLGKAAVPGALAYRGLAQ